MNRCAFAATTIQDNDEEPKVHSMKCRCPRAKKPCPTSISAFHFPLLIYTLVALIPRQIGERNMLGLFEYKLDGNGDALALDIKMDSVSAKALARLDRYISWSDVLKLTENDPEAAKAAKRLHTVLQHMGQ